MTYSKKSCGQIFKHWGKVVEQMPPHAQTLKTTIVTKFCATGSVVAKQKSRRFFFGGFALAGIALLFLVFVNSDLYKHGGSSSGSFGITSQTVNNSGVNSDITKGLDYATPNQGAHALTPTDFGIDQPIATGLADKSDSVIGAIGEYLYAHVVSTPAIDQREFLKTGYGAYIKTRAVKKIATRLSAMIRGYGGRVDNLSIDEKNGYLSFVLPKSSFMLFRTEIEDMISPRFLSENEHATNLLPQKKDIETQQASEQSFLTSLEEEKRSAIKKHAGIVATLKQQCSSLKNSLIAIDEQLKLVPDTTSASYYETINQRAVLVQQQADVEGRLTVENNRFNAQVGNIDAGINNSQNSLQAIKQQDKNLLADVETVDGSISLEWISLFGIVELYIPRYILFLVLVGVIGGAYYFRRRKISQLP